MSTPACPPKALSKGETLSLLAASVEPWRNLIVRIREALTRNRFYVASSEDLGVLWHGERIDAVERRRRITVFAAQQHWKVDTRTDGRAARFHTVHVSASFTGEVLSRNHE